MKLLLNFLLSLCLLLLGCWGNVQAGVAPVQHMHKWIGAFEQAKHVHIANAASRPQQQARSGLASADDDDDDLDEYADDDDDDRDDESSPFGKHILSRAYFINSFSPALPAYAASGNYNPSSFYKHFSFSSSDTYIVFCVIKV